MGAFSDVTIHSDTKLAPQSPTLQENLQYVNHLRWIFRAQVFSDLRLQMRAAPKADRCNDGGSATRL